MTGWGRMVVMVGRDGGVIDFDWEKVLKMRC
jgi:hypothetical protein